MKNKWMQYYKKQLLQKKNIIIEREEIALDAFGCHLNIL